MSRAGPLLVVSESDVTRGFCQVVLESEGWSPVQLYRLEQLDVALDGDAAAGVLVIDAALLADRLPGGWAEAAKRHRGLDLVCIAVCEEDCPRCGAVLWNCPAAVASTDAGALVAAVGRALRSREPSAA